MLSHDTEFVIYMPDQYYRKIHKAIHKPWVITGHIMRCILRVQSTV